MTLLEATTQVFGLWLRRIRTRAALRTLDARLLADVGLTACERRAECAKRFWRG